jgi:hypothetical protein
VSVDDLRSAAASEVDRWEGQLADEMTRLFDRQLSVVLARLQGTKARKHTRHWEPAGERKIDPGYVVDGARWARDAVQALAPLVRRMYDAVYTRVGKALASPPADPDAVESAIQGRLEGITAGVQTAAEEVQTFIDAEDQAGTAMPDIVAGVRDLYAQRTPTWVQRITTLSAVGTINHAALSAAFNAGSVQKRWVSRRDERVRDTHDDADGQTRPILSKFKLGGIPSHPATSELMFPGDPSGPLDEVINCRCTLAFSPPLARARAGGPTAGSSAARAAAAAGLVGAVAGAVALSAAGGAAVGAGAAAVAAGGTAAAAASGGGDQPPPQQRQQAQAKALPKTEKCARCDRQATKRVIWAEGMAYQPACDEHLDVVKTRIEKGHDDSEPYGPVDAVRDIKDDRPLEHKDKVRTVAGVRTYGQPIGSTIHRDPLTPAFSAGSRGTGASPTGSGLGSSPSRAASHGTIAGMPVEVGAADVYPLAAKFSPAGTAPDPATSQTIAIRDRKGRIGGYVIWATHDGAQPKGTILAVSVHPKLQGQKIGDQLVAAAAKVDPDIKVTTRPTTQTPSTATSVSVTNAPTRARAAGPVGLPTVRSRAVSTDQAGTSGDFKADAARIDRLQRAYLKDRQDTESLFSRGGRWSRAREAQQQEVIDHFLNKPGVKADHQILILGGLPGAGKTTFLNSPAGKSALGVDVSEFVTVNADEVKAEMIARGMVPDYPGLSDEESATLFHNESFEIAHSLMRQAAKRNLNFAYDTSLKSTGQVGFATQAGSRTAPPPWRTTMLFVDVPIAVAKQRARDRYLAGERYMPLGLIDGMRPSGRSRNSLPAENFDLVKRSADHWVVVDNSGAAPVVVGTGGGRRPANRLAGSAPASGRARPATPPAAPAVAPVAAPRAPTPPPAASPPVGTTPPPPPPVARVTVPAALPPPPAGARVYVHPQGKHIYLMPDGSMVVYKPDGKKATSSATPQKLAAGYGGWTELTAGPAPASSAPAPALVPNPKGAPIEQPSAPAPAGALPVAPMDFNEAPLADVPKYIADDDYVFQQKVDGIRAVLVVEGGKAPWFASKKGDRLVSSTAAKITGPLLAKLPATPAGSPGYRVEGELLNGKWHIFDMVRNGDEATPYEQRKAMADAWVAAVSPALPQIEALPTARTTAEKQALWDQVLASGAEGVMMKRRDSPYNGGARVSHSLKGKVTATADVVVLARNIGGHDNAQIALLQGGKVTPIGTVSTGGKDKALGQIQPGEVVEVEYLWASADNKLTQPRILRKRPDKTVADVTDMSQLRYVDKTVLALAAKALRLRLEYAVEVSA